MDKPDISMYYCSYGRIAHGLVSPKSSTKKGLLTCLWLYYTIQQSAMRHLIDRATCPEIAAQRKVWKWAVAAQCQDYSDGLVLLGNSGGWLLSGESGHQWTCGQCILLRPLTMGPPNACYAAELLFCNLFPLARDVLELSRVAESKGFVSLLIFLRVGLHP